MNFELSSCSDFLYNKEYEFLHQIELIWNETKYSHCKLPHLLQYAHKVVTTVLDFIYTPF